MSVTGTEHQPMQHVVWNDVELLSLMRQHAPVGVSPAAMLPMIRELVDSGADPRTLVATVEAARGSAPGAPAQDLPGAVGIEDAWRGGQHLTRTGPPAGAPRGRGARGAGWKRAAGRVVVVVFWLAVWEIADRVINNRLMLAGPIRTGQALVEQFSRPEFWLISGASLGRIALGFTVALVFGILLALVAHRAAWFREFIAPVVSVVKTVPVVSFIIMLLIWLGGQALTSWLAFLIVVPLVYTSMLAGLGAVGRHELERAQVYGVSRAKQFWYISRPAFMPFLASACKVGVGMSWRAGVMAELFAATAPSIGREMFAAKTFLDTPTLFAWTVVVMLLSVVFERLVMTLLRFLSRPFGGLLGSAS